MIIAAILSGLVSGTVGFLAGSMISASERADMMEDRFMEDRQTAAIQKVIRGCAGRQYPNVVNIEDYRHDYRAPAAGLSPR